MNLKLQKVFRTNKAVPNLLKELATKASFETICVQTVGSASTFINKRKPDTRNYM